MTRALRTLAAAALALTTLLGTQTVPVEAVDPIPPFIPADADWLSTVNYYRAMAGLGPVTENTSWSAGAYNHSCYMLYNGITHDELTNRTGYTTSGDTAGNNGNVAVSSVFGTSARSHIELWMTGPFHAIGILRHQLTSVGFGKCDMTSSPTSWRSGATLNILSGLGTTPRPANPILFPGNGTTTNLSQFVTESPNPLDFCGWTGTAGLPVIAMMPEVVNSASATMTGPNGPVQVCRIYKGNTTGTARDILAADNAVSVIPRSTLVPGRYTVSITTQARTVTWSFTVDPTAATGITPVPQVNPLASPSGFASITPFRFGDSRTSLRITRLLANTTKKVKVAGTAGLPNGVAAISGNVTVVNPSKKSNVIVYDCAATRPGSSTVNFEAGATMPNAGVFPLSADGYLCFFSPASMDLILDINGYIHSTATNTFVGVSPKPVLDTVARLNATGRTPTAGAIKLNVFQNGIGVPTNAKAIAISISGLNAPAPGFVTTYPCNIAVPPVSTLNLVIGMTKSNSAIVPISPNGEVCFYTMRSFDLRVELLGYFVPNGSGLFTPTTPTRVADTREVYRAEMNMSTSGAQLSAGQTGRIDLAGHRSIPEEAKSVSINVVAVGGPSAGIMTFWDCDSPMNTQTLAYPANRNIALGMQLKMSADGQICVRSTASLHVVVDVTGWWN